MKKQGEEVWRINISYFDRKAIVGNKSKTILMMPVQCGKKRECTLSCFTFKDRKMIAKLESQQKRYIEEVEEEAMESLEQREKLV